MSKILVRYSKYSNLQSLELEMNEPIDTLSDARLRIFQRMIFKFNIDVDLKIARTHLILQMEHLKKLVSIQRMVKITRFDGISVSIRRTTHLPLP